MRLTSWALAALLTIGIGSSIQAAEIPSPAILVIDANKIMEQSTAAQSVREQIEAKRQNFQKEIARYETELRQSNESLAKDQGKLSAAEFGKKKKAFESRVATVQSIVDTRRQQLEAGFNQSMQKIHETFQAVMKTITSEMGANIILRKDNLAYVVDGLEITDTVIKNLNEKMPTLNVSFPSEKEATKASR